MDKEMKREKSCGGVIIRENGNTLEVLVIKHNHGHWAFPKGHVEAAETEKETAEREIYEETGIKAETDTSFRRVNTYSPAPGIIKDVIYFTGIPVSGENRPQLSEVSNADWIDVNEALDILTYDADRELLTQALEYRKSKKIQR